MNPVAFDTLTRRASLAAAGAAGLAAFAHPITIDGKKKKRKKKGDINQFCKPQVEQCIAFNNPSGACEGDPYCACCSFFATCNMAGWFDCTVDAAG
jgi:hypothetical protein